jgi:DNA polymerase-3 subunit gamma/tau
MTLLRMIAFYPSLKLDKSNNGSTNFTKSEKKNEVLPDTNTNKNELIKIVEQSSPEQLQVLYQIVIHGKKDLYMAPDMTIGLNMTLLRMIAFYPSLKLDKSNNGNINFTKSEKKMKCFQTQI